MNPATKAVWNHICDTDWSLKRRHLAIMRIKDLTDDKMERIAQDLKHEYTSYLGHVNKHLFIGIKETFLEQVEWLVLVEAIKNAYKRQEVKLSKLVRNR